MSALLNHYREAVNDMAEQISSLKADLAAAREEIARLKEDSAQPLDTHTPRVVNYPYDFTTSELSGWWIIDKRHPGSYLAHTSRLSELNFIVNALNDATRAGGTR